MPKNDKSILKVYANKKTKMIKKENRTGTIKLSETRFLKLLIIELKLNINTFYEIFSDIATDVFFYNAKE